MNFLLNFYGHLMTWGTPGLEALLRRRLADGKEDPARIGERRGQSGLPRPDGKLIWIHGASVGEAQSTLVMIEQLRQHFPDRPILLTTGTLTSARYLAARLPAGVTHQFYPLDHPEWVSRFLNHWQPDFVLWMESELWPNMLMNLKQRHTPVILVNARISPRSQARWMSVRSTATEILGTFTAILTQTQADAESYRALGATNVTATGNLKFSASALPVDTQNEAAFLKAVGQRPRWAYASTHKGEEEMACRLHKRLAADMPDLLTVIVPRHPERRNDIVDACAASGLRVQLRGERKDPPRPDTDIYIADTLGELGLFYRASPIACIGRSFSDDGGGGHNPIEAAQLGCVVLHGPHIQNLAEIYRIMDEAGASRAVRDEDDFYSTLHHFLTSPEAVQKQGQHGKDFIVTQNAVLGRIMDNILTAFNDGHAAKATA